MVKKRGNISSERLHAALSGAQRGVPVAAQVRGYHAEPGGQPIKLEAPD
jgi:hypothetical protein